MIETIIEKYMDFYSNPTNILLLICFVVYVFREAKYSDKYLSKKDETTIESEKEALSYIQNKIEKACKNRTIKKVLRSENLTDIKADIKKDNTWRINEILLIILFPYSVVLISLIFQFINKR